MNRLVAAAALLGCWLFASGCAALSQQADWFALENGFEKLLLPAGPFTLTAYARIREPGVPLRIYIEGDGYAWIARDRPSADPSPSRPIALKLACRDKHPNIAYLARPYQFSDPALNPPADAFYWTDGRFSETVIAAMNQAVEALVQRYRPDGIELAGYSGGAAVAVLVAARRQDVRQLTTFAGNLDTQAVSRLHRVSTLSGSLNPIGAAAHLRDIPQIHYVGGKDKIVPPAIAERFVRASGSGASARIITVPEASHEAGWDKIRLE